MTMILPMPNPPNDGGVAEIKHTGTVIFVGANGTGKSRLGAWIEEANRPPKTKTPQITRIAAQRALTLPAEIPRASPAKAERDLQSLDGMPNQRTRVRGDPVLTQLTDYDHLLISLFAKFSSDILTYHQNAQKGPSMPPPETILGRLKSVWREVLPHRQLHIDESEQRILTSSASGQPYSGQEMSDGERVVLYLIAHTLLAPTKAKLLVDEPEIHIHRSIQARLWNSLQSARPDCEFLYITHDLDFAASRRNAVIVLLTSFDKHPSEQWRWEVVPRYANIPESLVLELLGSRNPTLFVEGDCGGLDQRIYETLYPTYYIRPVGNSTAVIDVVTGFRKNISAHHLKPFGCIDPDDKDSSYLEALRAKNVYSLGVAHVENLLVTHPVLLYAAKELGYNSIQTEISINQVKERLQKALIDDRARLIEQRAHALIQNRLRQFSPLTSKLEDLRKGYSDTVATADPSSAYNLAEGAIDNALKSGTLISILGIFRNKGVLQITAEIFGKSIDEYENLAIAALSDPAVRSGLSSLVPPLPTA